MEKTQWYVLLATWLFAVSEWIKSNISVSCMIASGVIGISLVPFYPPAILLFFITSFFVFVVGAARFIFADLNALPLDQRTNKIVQFVRLNALAAIVISIILCCNHLFPPAFALLALTFFVCLWINSYETRMWKLINRLSSQSTLVCIGKVRTPVDVARKDGDGINYELLEVNLLPPPGIGEPEIHNRPCYTPAPHTSSGGLARDNIDGMGSIPISYPTTIFQDDVAILGTEISVNPFSIHAFDGLGLTSGEQNFLERCFPKKEEADQSKHEDTPQSETRYTPDAMVDGRLGILRKDSQLPPPITGSNRE